MKKRIQPLFITMLITLIVGVIVAFLYDIPMALKSMALFSLLAFPLSIGSTILFWKFPGYTETTRGKNKHV